MSLRFALFCGDVAEQDPRTDWLLKLIRDNSPGKMICEGIVVLGEQIMPAAVQWSLAEIAPLYSVGGLNVHEDATAYCFLADIEMAASLFDSCEAVITLGNVGKLPESLAIKEVKPELIKSSNAVAEEIAEVVEASAYRGRVLCICNQVLDNNEFLEQLEIAKSFKKTHDVSFAILNDHNDPSAIEKLQEHANLIAVPHGLERPEFITELLKQTETVFNFGRQPNWHINGRLACGQYDPKVIRVAYVGTAGQIAHLDASVASLRAAGHQDEITVLADCNCLPQEWSRPNIHHKICPTNHEHLLWVETAKFVMERYPDDEFFMLVRPDAVFCKGSLEAVRSALTDQFLSSTFDILSLYTPAHDNFLLEEDRPGWASFVGYDPWGDVALVVRRSMLERLCGELYDGPVFGAGYSIHNGVKQVKLDMPNWYTHQPSLVDRLGTDCVIDSDTRQRSAFSPVAWDPDGRGLRYLANEVQKPAAAEPAKTTEPVISNEQAIADGRTIGDEAYCLFVNNEPTRPTSRLPIVSELGTLQSCPKVSVVLPVFNGERYLTQAIASILVQTYTNWELIIVDDGSTDTTPRIARQLMDPRICIIELFKNGKLPAALNKGFRLASGDLLTWISCDNIYRPEMLGVFVSHLQDPQTDVVYSNGITMGENGDNLRLHVVHDPEILEQANCVSIGFMYRRKVFETVGIYREEFFLAEDYDFFLRAFKAGFKFKHLPDVLFYNRDHPGQLGQQFHEKVRIAADKVREANKVQAQ